MHIEFPPSVSIPVFLPINVLPPALRNSSLQISHESKKRNISFQPLICAHVTGVRMTSVNYACVSLICLILETLMVFVTISFSSQMVVHSISALLPVPTPKPDAILPSSTQEKRCCFGAAPRAITTWVSAVQLWRCSGGQARAIRIPFGVGRRMYIT